MVILGVKRAGGAEMLSDVSWFGIDFAFTMMNPLTMHHSVVIPEMYRLLGRPEEGAARFEKWTKLRDSMGSPSDPPHQKVRLLKEYNRERFHAEVFDNDPRAIRMYAEMEAKARMSSPGLADALKVLNRRKKHLSVVSEVASVDGTLAITAFMQVNGILGLFDEMITPAGRFAPQGKLLDEAPFKGATKKEGTIYIRLANYLDSKGIRASERAMIGDDPKLDIDLAKQQGFVTVQYRGIVDRGRAEHADLVISKWQELLDAM